MSALTLALLGRTGARGAKKWHPRLRIVAELLVEEYGVPVLGNHRDAVKEIFYIVLAARTTESLYAAASEKLWQEFQTLPQIANASLRDLRRCIGRAGLGGKRSRQVRHIAKALTRDFGSSPGRKMRTLSPETAYNYLVALPGVGPKSALCVMMYSLGFDAFPVDTHVRRVMGRIGIGGSDLKHYKAQEQFPAFVPPGYSKNLHVGLVVHGRQVCTSRSPKCTECVLRGVCNFRRSAAR